MKTKIAIACQGGGSHTAFTAGVLKKLLERQVDETHEIVGLSGASGGAICGLLAWNYLLRRRAGRPLSAERCMLDFWRDNTAQVYWELLWNSWSVGLVRLQGAGTIPEVNISPYSASLSWAMEQAQEFAPRREFLDFGALVQKHISFAELDELAEASSPRLLMGAVDVLSGEFKAFDSWRNEITLEATLASAAIPTLFRAVKIGDHAYWDGLFSENPPLNSLLGSTDLQQKPDEIWIVQINPVQWKKEPESMPDILDRRNELAGNLSLHHAVDLICRINAWIKQGFTEEGKARYKPVTLRRISMSHELTDRLDYASKIDRGGEHIATLIDDGEQQARLFLDDMDAHRIPCA